MTYIREKFEGLRTDWTSARDRYPRLAGAVAIASLVLVVGTVGGSAWALRSLLDGLPDEQALSRIGEMDQATAVLDIHDRPAFTIYKEQRIEVPLDEMSPHLLSAILAIEDQRFYEHRGFDAVRIASAALANVREGRRAQGGSTITQQLARQSFLTPDKTFRRKLQELILAGRMERVYPKARILELYLNKVYFGDGLYGVEAASRGFFGKRARDLSVGEAALLAGLVKSPSTYAPTVSMERALARRNLVLQMMRENGALERAAFEEALASRVTLKDSLRADEPHGQYFKEQVRQELVERFGWQRVYQGGLRVYTTIDLSMQKAAEQAVAEGLKSVEARRKPAAAGAKPEAAEADPLQAALISMDPRTGYVYAMIGGRNFEESKFNRAVQAKRQPGSAFKPFVYAAALEAGFTPATMIVDLNMPIETLQGDWTPEDEHSTSDSMSLRTALRTSSNRAAVRLLQDVGIAKTVTYAKSLGVGDVPSVPSLALGSGEVTLQSLTAAYAAFANKGNVPQPLIIRRVDDKDGATLFSAEPVSTRAITETTAYLMSNMMADVINAGTGARARRAGFTLPAAGKTGTTNDYKDAWFVGFTPSLITGVWVGFDQPRTIVRGGFAGEVAVPMWAAFMRAATRGDEPAWFTPPRGVTSANVCRLSGHLASEGCTNVEVIDEDGHATRRSMVYTEYFARGTQPTRTCDLHPTRGLLGTLASVFTGGTEPPPPPRIQDTGLQTVADAAPAAAEASQVGPTAAQEEPPRRRRGFWSRLFGIGSDDDRNDRNDRNRDERSRTDEKKPEAAKPKR